MLSGPFDAVHSTAGFHAIAVEHGDAMFRAWGVRAAGQ